MKKGICLIERLYVPYGQTVHVESLRVDKLIVDGSLIVEGKISAVICRGKGSAQVGDMEVDKLHLSSVTCEGSLKAREVISRRVYAESIHISKRIWCLISLVAKYLVAPYAATPLLGCENGDLQDCVIVPQRDYSLRRFRRTVCWHHSSAIRSLSVERLLGEYDMDQIRQEQYSAALRRMQDTLKPLGIPYIQQMWNPAYNGIDDYKLHSRWLPLAA